MPIEEVVALNPFDGAPLSVVLPSLANGEEPLLSFQGDLNNFQMELFVSTTDLPEANHLTISKPPGVTDTVAWIVSHIGEAELQIARFTLAERQLGFQWSRLARAQHHAWLRNCLLRLSAGKHSHVLCLRNAETVEPPQLNMDKPRDVHRFAIAEPPRDDTLCLYLAQINGLPSGGRFREANRELTLGQKAIIEFTEMPGAELEVQFITQSDGLAIAISPVFHEDSATEIPMTRPRLTDALRAIPRTMSITKAKAARNTAEIRRLSGVKIDNPTADAGRVGKIRQLEQENNGYARDLLVLQAKLDNAPKIEALLNALHGHAIPFRIVAAVEEGTIALVEAGYSDPPATKAP